VLLAHVAAGQILGSETAKHWNFRAVCVDSLCQKFTCFPRAPCSFERGDFENLNRQRFSCASGARFPFYFAYQKYMLTLIEQPSIIEFVGTKPKRIEEYIGRVNSGGDALSVARMVSPAGWEEPTQTP
jgi:hypothetical protein